MDAEDRKAFQRAIKLSPNHKLRRLLALVFPLLGLCILLRTLDLNPVLSPFGIQDFKVEIGAPMWALLAMLVIFGVFWAVLERARNSRFIRSTQSAGPLTIETTEEDISVTVASHRETLFWHAHHQLIETETHFFVLRARKVGLIIPKRAFESPAQCAEFGALLKQKWAQHHPDAAPIAAAK